VSQVGSWRPAPRSNRRSCVRPFSRDLRSRPHPPSITASGGTPHSFSSTSACGPSRGSSALRKQRAVLRRPGKFSPHSPQGRLFVVCLAPEGIQAPPWLGQPRNRGSRRRLDALRRHKPVSLPCPKWDRGDLPPAQAECSNPISLIIQPRRRDPQPCAPQGEHGLALRQPGLLFRHSPQGRLFVARLAPTTFVTTTWLGQPRHRGSRRRHERRRGRAPVSLPCPRWDRGDRSVAVWMSLSSNRAHDGRGSSAMHRVGRLRPSRSTRRRCAAQAPSLVALHKVGCSRFAMASPAIELSTKLGQPRTRGFRRQFDRRRGRKPVSLPCPMGDRGELRPSWTVFSCSRILRGGQLAC
jgi:hypothetical protein